jgi:hypothetical protein
MSDEVWESDDWVRRTVVLPALLAERLAARAEQRGLSFSDLLVGYAQDGLDRDGAGPAGGPLGGVDGTHLVDPVPVRQQPCVLGRADRRPAPLADLARDMKFVVLRIEVLDLPGLLLLLLEVELRGAGVLARHPVVGFLPQLMAVVGSEIRS